MDDKSILERISDLVDEEHTLRSRVQAGQISVDEEHARLKTLEEALDQCWDLLRRRRAARDSGEDPAAVTERPLPEVEGYLQ
jgi:septation ring formation regulator EzrA